MMVIAFVPMSEEHPLEWVQELTILSGLLKTEV
jgi:hypothetical protein